MLHSWARHDSFKCDPQIYSRSRCRLVNNILKKSWVWSTNIFPIMQHTATHCNTLQHTATHCNTAQHSIQKRPARSWIEEEWSVIHKHIPGHAGERAGLFWIDCQQSIQKRPMSCVKETYVALMSETWLIQVWSTNIFPITLSSLQQYSSTIFYSKEACTLSSVTGNMFVDHTWMSHVSHMSAT